MCFGGLRVRTTTDIILPTNMLLVGMPEPNTMRLMRGFVKKGKKEVEKEEKQKAKAEADLPDQIDLPALEAEFKEIISRVSDKLKKMKFGILDVETISAYEVEAYGEKSPLGDLAQVIIKNDTTAQITVYDPDMLNNVRKVAVYI